MFRNRCYKHLAPNGAKTAPWWKAMVRGMKQLTRITIDPNVMGGKPCIRDLRVTVGTIVGLTASGHSRAEILKLYPYLEQEDLREALVYAAWRAMEIEPALVSE